MDISQNLLKWLKKCPYVDDVEQFDINMLNADESVGLFKQPTTDILEFVDGSKIVTDHYYFLFKKSAQLKAERFSNEEYLRNIEEWVNEQEENGKYPDIGYPVEEIALSNGYYMMNYENEEATYQVMLYLQYRKDR